MCFGGAKAISNVEASGPKKAPFLEHFLPTFFSSLLSSSYSIVSKALISFCTEIFV